ncbi:MAG TPA: aldo/keto reductase [Burkholderiaceae bacterium]|nr:aldo/keto reductase [Burkholderiaceae bacterium]
MRTVTLPDRSTRVPALGLGTWRMGEVARRRQDEVAALRLAIELGYRLIDTAEMYGEGGAEQVVGQALAEALRAGTLSRDELFIVSKVYPHNASRAGVVAACERSRKRLGLDRIDLYLLHWAGSYPIAETIAGFETLCEHGRIAHWGVSNFDADDMESVVTATHGQRCAANQVYYSVAQRAPEFALLPWQRARGMPLMAYCPIDQGDLASSRALQALADARGATAAQLALAWLVAQPGVIAIPKAVREDHLRENLAAADQTLTEGELAAIDKLFPAPRKKTALAMR